ncbi:hypothetical protein CDAR_180631 [Caerostris darwini]|uniref:Uncharacterized protein n=1 Tax=Caerostris darwini TaxID=1538125 RepID=A0AAV4NM14_9ARAC|nr:hypothetical protein CDAR_258681 [Caerostris darwini]GIX94718.1 hypothetical protein CDAR_180631 [Caerostris darwini]
MLRENSIRGELVPCQRHWQRLWWCGAPLLCGGDFQRLTITVTSSSHIEILTVMQIGTARVARNDVPCSRSALNGHPGLLVRVRGRVRSLKESQAKRGSQYRCCNAVKRDLKGIKAMKNSCFDLNIYS